MAVKRKTTKQTKQSKQKGGFIGPLLATLAPIVIPEIIKLATGRGHPKRKTTKRKLQH